MKAAAFAYARPASLEDALRLLSVHGDRAKVLSGGQSLMPAMNLRLITPEIVVDIAGLAELKDIVLSGKTLKIGALTRHVDLLRSAEVAEHAPLLAEAIKHVAHPAIRNRGTIGGSLAHADPAAELPACMLALNATIITRGAHGDRRIPANNFFQGIFQTALTPDELLIGVELPIAQQNEKHFFQEFSRRHGDYAIAGLAAQAVIDHGVFEALRLAFFALEDRPRVVVASDVLLNVPMTPALISSACDLLDEELSPQDDQQASSAMRRHLATVLLKRCIATMTAHSSSADRAS